MTTNQTYDAAGAADVAPMPSSLSAVRVVDVRMLNGEPKVPNCLKWAEDGSLAAACGNHVAILNPSDLEGSVSIGVLDACDVDVLDAPGGEPDGPDIYFNLSMPVMNQYLATKARMEDKSKKLSKERDTGERQEDVNPAEPRAIAWSPIGMATAGGCLLSVIGEDHQISILGFTEHVRVEYDVIFQPSSLVLEYLKRTKWDMVDKLGNLLDTKSFATKTLNAYDLDVVNNENAASESVLRSEKGVNNKDNVLMIDPQVQASPKEIKLNGKFNSSLNEREKMSKFPIATNWQELPPVDVRNMTTMRKSLLEGCVRRFFRLRKKIDPSELPRYESTKAHLSGVDMQLLEHITFEYCKIYRNVLNALDYSEEKWRGAFRAKLRSVWNPETGEMRTNFDPFSDGGLVHIKYQKEMPSPISRCNKITQIAHKNNAEAIKVKEKAKAYPSAKRGRPKGSYAAKIFGKLSRSIYDHRLLSVSFISIEWSPSVCFNRNTFEIITSGVTSRDSDAGTAVSFLAAGTKEGLVWLWMCESPISFRHPGFQSEEYTNLKDRMHLLGYIHVGCISHITAISWVLVPHDRLEKSTYLLFCGTSEGSIYSFAAEVQSLMRCHLSETLGKDVSSSLLLGLVDLDNGLPMTRLEQIMQPDQLEVISMDACLRVSSEEGTDEMVAEETSRRNGPHVALAVGKTAGSIAVWLSGELPKETISDFANADSISSENPMIGQTHEGYQEAMSLGSVFYPPGMNNMAPHTITSVVLQASGEIMTSCDRNGTTLSWTLPHWPSSKQGEDIMTLQECVAPRSFSGRPCGLEYQGYGMAASPGGVFLSSMSINKPMGWFFVKQLQTHQKFHDSKLVLYRLAGRESVMVDLSAVVIIVIEGWICRRLPASALWDVLQITKHYARWSEDRSRKGLDDLLQNLLPHLEEGVFPGNSGENKSVSLLAAELPSLIPTIVWRQLKAAVSLRRAVCADFSQNTDIINRNEVLLFQLYLEALLKGSRCSENEKGEMKATSSQARVLKETQLIAADWILVNKFGILGQLIFPGMVVLAEDVYKKYNEDIPKDLRDIPARHFAVPDSLVQLTCKPPSSNKPFEEFFEVVIIDEDEAHPSDKDDLKDRSSTALPRCPTTLLPCVSAHQWRCRLCDRLYDALPLVQNACISGVSLPISSENSIECIFCGGLLGPLAPTFTLRPPCM